MPSQSVEKSVNTVTNREYGKRGEPKRTAKFRKNHVLGGTAARTARMWPVTVNTGMTGEDAT